MKKNLIAAAVIFAFAASAQASVFGDTTNNNQTYNQPAAHATANGGHGGQGGSATGGAASVGDIRNTNTNTALGGAGGSVVGSGNSANTNANSNLNAQGQHQGQGQSQSTSNANNSSQSVTVEGDTYEAQKRNPVSTAYAPAVMPTAPCMGSTSAGISTVGFSLSGGGTWTDDNCVLLEQVRATSNLGEAEVAQEMMMGIPAYAAAKKRIADRKTAKTATPSSITAFNEGIGGAAPAAHGYTGNDPIVMSRLGILPLSK